MSEVMEQLTGETCPVCHEKTLTLTEATRDVPYFGVCYLFSMGCESCKYHKADLEAEGKHGKSNFTLNHLAERIKFYIDEHFEYQTHEVQITPSTPDLNTLVGRL